MALTVVILAAGQGTRMKSALPKVLQPLAGRPLLAHVLDRAEALKPARIVVVYGHGGDLVRETFADRGLQWALQSEQLGTGHAVQQAVPDIPDDHRVLVLCGDVPQIKTSSLEPMVSGASDGVTVLTANLPDPTGYGRIVRKGGAVTGIVEHKDATEEELAITEINTGMMAAPADRLKRWLANLKADNAQQEYYLTDIIGMAIADGLPVNAVSTARPEEGLGVNDRRQLAEAERGLQRDYANALMAAGATLADPSRIDVRGDVRVGQDVFIDVNVVLEGEVELGDRVRVGVNTVIRNASIGADTTIEPNCVIDDARVGDGCSVGPFTRLRPGAELADRAKAGNFVEIKKSQIGPGSKVNHLTYIGDATVGADVNVGCGTITCNYDGANKHRTVIGDGAFIGSGVELVAPVTVEPGATIGAGTTLTKDAPEGQLTLGRARQATIKGWQRPRKSTGVTPKK